MLESNKKQSKQLKEQSEPHIFATQKKQPKQSNLHNNLTQKKMGPNNHRYAWDKNGRIDGRKQASNLKGKRLSKQEIQRLYEDLVNRSQYTEAGKVKVAIRYMKNNQNSTRIRRLSQQHSVQKQAVKQSHKQQMKYFRQAWRQVFIQQAMKDRLLMQHYDRLKTQQQQQCKMRIARRCQSAKPTIGIAKLNQIQQVQRILRKRGKTVQLRFVRDQKHKIIQKCRKQQQQTINRIVEQQWKKANQKQTRRYRSFMHRIQQSQRDNQRLYKREEQKLKQKYKNILKNLQHQQNKDFSFLMSNIQKSQHQ